MKTADWAPPSDWRRIRTIDAHTAGEPFRVITNGFPEIPGDTMLSRRRYAKEHLDHLRTVLMWEPRGHADMYGCIVTPPVSPETDIGVLFIHNEGYSTMCGHGIIGIATVVLETGMLPMELPETTIRIDTPAGLVTAHARIENGHVTNVYFHNVASFVVSLDDEVEVPGFGRIRYDLAFGGAFYAYVRAADLGLTCGAEDFRALIQSGMAIKEAVTSHRAIRHPVEKDLGFLYGTIFTEDAPKTGSHSRNVCIFANGEVDRSPTGTGVSGRLAILHDRDEIKVGQQIIIESIIGSTFKGRVVAKTDFAGRGAVIPEVEGVAYITGCHEFLLDPRDQLQNGFLLR